MQRDKFVQGSFELQHLSEDETRICMTTIGIYHGHLHCFKWRYFCFSEDRGLPTADADFCWYLGKKNIYLCTFSTLSPLPLPHPNPPPPPPTHTLYTDFMEKSILSSKPLRNGFWEHNPLVSWSPPISVCIHCWRLSGKTWASCLSPITQLALSWEWNQTWAQRIWAWVNLCLHSKMN